MTRRTVLIFLFLAVLGSFRCGKKGAILPPLVRVPQPVENVSLSRVGNRVILSWTNPTAYIDGNPLKGRPEVEIWVLEAARAEGATAEKPGPSDFEKRGRLLKRIPGARPAPAGQKELPAEPASVILEPDPGALAQKTLFYSLRARDERRRPSEFSGPVSPASGPSLPPPQELKASVLEKSIDLSWVPPAGLTDSVSSTVAGYNVYRSEGESVPVRLNAGPLAALEFRDENFSFGKTYVYFVRSAGAAAPGNFESENSEPIKVEPADKFSPAAPRGLTLISGDGFIALSWEPSNEPDLAGYRVWRHEPGRTTPVLLKELSPAESSFSDTEVENNRRYVYAITAFDRAGNESAKSAEVTGLARRPSD